MGTWSAHGRCLANVHVTDWIYIYICAKFRVTENRCVLFNSLTYVYLALLPEHWSLYAKVDSTLTYIYIYIYIYIFREREERWGKQQRLYFHPWKYSLCCFPYLNIYHAPLLRIEHCTTEKSEHRLQIHTYIYIYIYIYIYLYLCILFFIYLSHF